MRHLLLNRYLLASVCFAAADDARAKAEAAKKNQADNAEKKQADEASADAQANEPGPDPRADGNAKSAADAVRDGDAPAESGEAVDVKSLLSRLDAQERLIQTLTAQMQGRAGPAPDENKDVSAVSPGAAFDPRMTRVLPAGVSSAPSTQPIPAVAAEPSIGVETLGARAIWGNDAKGEPVRAKTYGGLDETDLMVVAAGYHDDRIYNPGDIIRGYTGPAGSWFVPLDLYNEVGPEEAIKQFGKWRKANTRAAA